jgi:hypothetical protein
MKQPTRADFDVEIDDAVVHVVFRPTESYYDYYLLADGGLSRPPIIRHAKRRRLARGQSSAPPACRRLARNSLGQT